MPAQFFQGFLLEADTSGAAKSLGIRDAETGMLHPYSGGPALSQILHNGQTQIAYSFTPPFIGHLVRDEPQDLVPWRKFGISWVTQPTPEAATEWATQDTSHGLRGFQHISRIEASWEASANVTLNVAVFDGTSPAAITLPALAGVVQKALLTPTFNKGQLFRYTATSTAPFRLFLEDWTVWVNQWGSAGAPVAWRGLGGSRGEAAQL